MEDFPLPRLIAGGYDTSIFPVSHTDFMGIYWDTADTQLSDKPILSRVLYDANMLKGWSENFTFVDMLKKVCPNLTGYCAMVRVYSIFSRQPT